MNKKSGISLIVLVITIIVIIILAVAVILTLSNNNPIENARRAVDANDEATMKEAATLAYSDWYMKKNLDGEDVGEAESYVKDQLEEQGFKEELINRLTVTNEGKITIGSTAPVIPKGFEYKEGTVETGYVIKNTTDGNEFVWVPVEIGTFIRESFGDEYWNTTDYEEPFTNSGAITESEEITEYNAMVASVSKYGGFYIARYEASKNDTTDKAQSIANKTPWHTIVWGTSMTDVTGGAVEAARAVYPDSTEKTTGDAVSILPYGVQWDATVRFLETNYPDITQDSTGYGNYSTVDYETEETIYIASLIPTGSNSDYALNNIYDMAGNVSEWTMEVIHYDGCFYRIVRGGYYALDGDGAKSGFDGPVSYRADNEPDDPADDSLGFRLALYIK